MRIKKFTTINPRTKEVFINAGLASGGTVKFTANFSAILKELSNVYGYNIQITIDSGSL
ncbi:hypothetical protein [Pedobacter sp. NJ-S-72]